MKRFYCGFYAIAVLLAAAVPTVAAQWPCGSPVTGESEDFGEFIALPGPPLPGRLREGASLRALVLAAQCPGAFEGPWADGGSGADQWLRDMPAILAEFEARDPRAKRFLECVTQRLRARAAAGSATKHEEAVLQVLESLRPIGVPRDGKTPVSLRKPARASPASQCDACASIVEPALDQLVDNWGLIENALYYPACDDMLYFLAVCPRTFYSEMKSHPDVLGNWLAVVDGMSFAGDPPAPGHKLADRELFRLQLIDHLKGVGAPPDLQSVYREILKRLKAIQYQIIN